jgi:hypothetical protein
MKGRMFSTLGAFLAIHVDFLRTFLRGEDQKHRKCLSACAMNDQLDLLLGK